ncbi:transcriptional regulator [Pseudomonas daroniae]|nr:transcriptional regulator [Pseudomonas daroniae]
MNDISEIHMNLAANLKRFRAARGLTQQQVWEAAGISKSSYTGYESGHGMPAADKALALAKVLGVSTDELLMSERELSVSEDMKPILRRFEALPLEIRNQARIALKGVLFGFEQETIR